MAKPLLSRVGSGYVLAKLVDLGDSIVQDCINTAHMQRTCSAHAIECLACEQLQGTDRPSPDSLRFRYLRATDERTGL